MRLLFFHAAAFSRFARERLAPASRFFDTLAGMIASVGNVGRTVVVSLGLLLAAGGAAGAETGAGGFTFSPPPGWIDISRGAPEAQRQQAPPALVAQADNPGMAFVAFDPASGDDGFVENMNAVVETGKRPPLATPEGLVELEKMLETELGKQGMTYRSLKMEVVKVGGVTAGRLVGEMKVPNGLVNLVQFAIPGKQSHATLTFTTTPDKLAHYEPIFDAAAQATLGAVEPRAGSSIKDSAIRGAIIGGIAGGIGALIAGMMKRRRRAAEASRPPASGPG